MKPGVILAALAACAWLWSVNAAAIGVDRIRNSCSNICVCGAPEACNPNIREPNL